MANVLQRLCYFSKEMKDILDPTTNKNVTAGKCKSRSKRSAPLKRSGGLFGFNVRKFCLGHKTYNFMVGCKQIKLIVEQ
jgi:hypothetical protein